MLLRTCSCRAAVAVYLPRLPHLVWAATGLLSVERGCRGGAADGAASYFSRAALAVRVDVWAGDTPAVFFFCFCVCGWSLTPLFSAGPPPLFVHVSFSPSGLLPIPLPALSAILRPRLPPTQNGYFKIDVVVPPSYPLSPPNVRLLSKVFHPNVHPKSGEVCLDILKAAWSPAWTLASTARALIVLLGHPEPDSPLNCDAGNLLRAGDGRAFRSLARMYTKLCAGPPPEVAALQGDR